MASPMYQLIAQDLRERIESGELPPGEQLPTELELRARYGAARNTVGTRSGPSLLSGSSSPSRDRDVRRLAARSLTERTRSAWRRWATAT
jgi:DNA-binding transcriptional MocR family regulator